MRERCGVTARTRREEENDGLERKSRERGGLVKQKEGRADYFRVASVDQSAGSGSEPELARGRESTETNLTISPRGPIKSGGLLITAMGKSGREQ